jgi:ribosomal protein S18 acetylase RimI-like enzyme
VPRANDEPVRVTRLDRSQVAQAVLLLSRVFNESAAELKKELDEAFTSDPYHPVLFAAVAGEKVVGVIACNTGPEYKRSNVFAFNNLAVDPEFRGRGLGQKLVHEAEAFVGKEWMEGRPGTVAVIDGTKKDNPRSRFYEDMAYSAGADPVYRDGQPVLKKRLNVNFRPN